MTEYSPPVWDRTSFYLRRLRDAAPELFKLLVDRFSECPCNRRRIGQDCSYCVRERALIRRIKGEPEAPKT